MRQRDVIAARRFYEFAAAAGVAGAATAIARTYDPLYLQQVGVRGVQADPETALRWYKRARQEADTEARTR
jgi:TPR repeat protein